MLNSDYAAKLFGILYDNVDGYSVSHEARANHVNGAEIMYGELPFATWSAIVEAANPKKMACLWMLVLVQPGLFCSRICFLISRSQLVLNCFPGFTTRLCKCRKFLRKMLSHKF